MKKYNHSKTLYEIIIPLDGSAESGELFDDCPMCQELKRRMQSGEVEEIPIQVDLREDN